MTLSVFTASKSLKAEGGREMTDEQSGRHSEIPPLGFTAYKVEGDLDRGLWWTLLTTA